MSKRKKSRSLTKGRPRLAATRSAAPLKGQRQALVVLGMHRSGTSALARVCSLLGADLPTNLMPGGVSNERGHWESNDLAVIHDEFLSKIGSKWDDWREIEPDCFRSSLAETYKQRILQVLHHEFENSTLFLVKDPRICRFVPIWLDVLNRFGAEAKIVIPVRNPLETAASLKNRNEFPPAKSYLLYLRHVLDAEMATRGSPRVFVTYDALLNDWRALITRVSVGTNLVWPRLSDRATLDVEQFLSAALRHHVSNDEQLAARGEIVDWVKETHDVLSQLADGSGSQSQLIRLNRVRESFNKASRAFGQVLMFEADGLSAAKKQQAVQLSELEATKSQFDALSSNYRNLEAQLLKERETYNSLAEVHNIEIQTLRSGLAEQERLSIEHNVQFENAQRRIVILGRELDTAREWLRDAQTMAQQLAGEFDSVQNALKVEKATHEGTRYELDRAATFEVRAAVAEEALLAERSLLEGQQAEIISLHAKCDGLLREIADLRAELSIREDEVDSERARSRCVTVEKEQLLSQIEVYQALCVTAERKFEAVEAELAVERDRIAESVRIRESLTVQLGIERARAEQSRRRHEDSIAQSCILQEQAAASIAQLTAERDRYQADTLKLYTDLVAQSELTNRTAQALAAETARAAEVEHDRALLAERAEITARDLAVLQIQAETLRTTVSEQATRLAPQPQRGSRFRTGLSNLKRRFARWNVAELGARGWEAESIRASRLFSPLWYLNRYPDVAASGDDPLAHYLTHGVGEGRDPHPLFDSRWYRERHPQTAAAGMSPLAHYATIGVSEGLDPHPLFDTDFYLRNMPDAEHAGTNPLYHYLTKGGFEGRDPHPMFSSSWYLVQNPDVARARDNPLVHYISHGWKEGRDPHPEFDTAWYLESNPDVAEASENPLIHYVTKGKAAGKEARRPSERSGGCDKDKPANDGENSLTLSSELATELPPLLSSMLRMFHDDSGDAMLRRCYKVLMRYVDIELSDRDVALFPEVSDLVADITRMSRSISSSSEVKVSIVIPVFNKFVYTLCCVYSLLSVARRTDFEILIADDVSSDATAAVFASVGGVVQLVRQQQNLGFLRNCNTVAANAKGEFIVLLNNDTFVLPGWLEELIGTLEGDPQIGLAGSKLVNADGTLQEAGGIVWKDASAWNFGRGDDPSAPQYNYLKDVDYISGASIALRKEVWDRLGGFDEAYVPAYFEDTDLAFRVRQAGLRTVYQPFSALIHHEGVSHGRDTATGIKAYQERNRETFRSRWMHILESEHFANATNVPLARDRSRNKPRIFVADHYAPQPDRDAGSRSMMHYIELFVRSGFHVTFWPHNRHFDRPYVIALQRLGIETIYGANHKWPEFEEWLEVNGGILDYAFLSRPHVAIDFIEHIRRRTHAKVLFYGHDIHFRRLQQQLEVTSDVSLETEIGKWEALERGIWPRCDVIYYPSVEEQRFVESQGVAAKVRTLPLNIFDEERLARVERRVKEANTPKGRQLLFVGGFRHQPNVDAMQWFMSGCWPIIKATVPNVTLVIAGSSPPPEIRVFADADVTVTGEVSDAELMELYDKTSVAIVPLRFGGGMKGKVLEALSLGVPLVTTPVGLQGLDAEGSYSWCASEPDAFALQVILTLNIENNLERIVRSLRGIEMLRSKFSNTAAKSALSEGISHWQ